MRVLYVCTEIFPLLKTGGLGDVSGALPPALREAGCDVRVLVPGFPAFRHGVEPARPGHAQVLPLPVRWGPHVGHGAGPGPCLVRAALPGSGLPVYVLDARHLFDRPGNPYLDSHGDNAVRFALLGWAASCLAHGMDNQWRPHIVHCNDWHTGLAPLYLRQSAMPGPPPASSVFTVHNLAYQGTFPRSVFPQLGLPDYLYNMHGVEFYGQVSFMKAGLQSADAITTVSPTYAHEILQPEQGCGLDGLLRARARVVHGILNGVDYGVWNPARDAGLPRAYDLDDLTGKADAKAALQQALGLQEQPAAPLFGVVSRLTEQKGLHLVEAAVDLIVARGGQMVVLGAGDAPLEQAFLRAAERHPSRVAVRIGYDEGLAHLIMAACDIALVPSRFEPCGLTQLYALRYGALPLVHRVGGLADTVVDATREALQAGTATGFAFDDFTLGGLLQAVSRAFALREDLPLWQAMQRRAMSERFDWRDAAAQYVALYRQLQPHVTAPA